MRVFFFIVVNGLVAQAQLQAQLPQEPPSIIYKLKGDKELFPDHISDDGAKTYIYWTSEKELPAVFAVNDQGQEILIDGYMRGEHYTIDRVYPRYVFRLDKDVARATREIGKR